MMRLFVGLEIPDLLRKKLALLKGGIPGARWLEPENYHITITFIGDVEETLADQIALSLSSASAGTGTFPLTVKGMGVFEEGHHPRTLWAGVEPAEALSALKAKVDKALRQAGVEVENRRYIPHVTLARFRRAEKDKVGQFIMDNNLFHEPPFEIGEFVLFQSHVSGEGSHYVPLGRYPLGNNI